MSIKNNKHLVPLCASILTGIYTWYLFRSFFLNWGTGIINNGGDGLKNYYTQLYHILYGRGSHFTGMNYPYGEHVVFTDNEPIFTWFISVFHSYFHFDLHQLLGIFNMQFPIAFMLACYFVYKFLTLQNCHALIRIIFPIFIIGITPQLVRIGAHYALMHCWYIPALMYYIEKYMQHGRQKKYLVFITCISIIVGFIHVYHLGFGVVLIGFYCMVSFVQHFKTKPILENIKSLFPLIVSVMLSFVTFKFFLFYTDIVKDRPTTPWGFFNYVCYGRDYLSSYISPFGNLFSMLTLDKKISEGEGYCFMGILTILFSFLLIITFLIRLVNKYIKKDIAIPKVPKNYTLWYIVALCTILLSMGVPFVWHMEWLVDYIASFKQFRGLNRFGYISYYILATFMAISVSNFIKNNTSNLYTKICLSILVLLCIIIELFSYGDYVQKIADRATNKYHEFITVYDSKKLPLTTLSNTCTINPNNFQTIIALPFYNIGAEKIGTSDEQGTLSASIKLSLLTSLPLVNTFLSRMSWSQAFDKEKLIGGAFTNKDAFTTRINNKPILVAKLRGGTLTFGEQNLLINADSIGESEEFIFYSLPWQKQIAFEKYKIDSIKQLSSQIKSLYHASFDTNCSVFANPAYCGNYLNTSTTEDLTWMIDWNAPCNKPYEYSCWTLINAKDYRVAYFEISGLDSNNTQTFLIDCSGKFSTDFYEKWHRCSRVFTPPDNTKKIKITFKNFDKKSCDAIDEMDIRDVTANTSYTTQGIWYINNHRIK